MAGSKYNELNFFRFLRNVADLDSKLTTPSPLTKHTHFCNSDCPPRDVSLGQILCYLFARFVSLSCLGTKALYRN
eukprot:679806-Amphidinium_carterae.1